MTKEEAAKAAYMTPQKVAEAFRVDRRTVYRWMQGGYLPYVKAGRFVLIPQAAVDAILDGGGKPYMFRFNDDGTVEPIR